MGLAAPKKKNKLSHDPNNTRWTNNTQSFGHKILTSQGWKQGEFLGAKNAIHAEYHTTASSTHIRVTLKDDNLGLGAKIGSGVGHGECTGLDAFKNLLGRLNGKNDDQIEKEQKARDDIRRAVYTEKRWGSVRFVSAGFLVGDKIQDLINAEAKRTAVKIEENDVITTNLEKSTSSTRSDPVECTVQKKLLSSKKRKAHLLEEADVEISSSNPSKKRSSRKITEDTNRSDSGSVVVTQTKKIIQNSEEKVESAKKSESKNKKREKRSKERKSVSKSKKKDKFLKSEKKSRREKDSSNIPSPKQSLQSCSAEEILTASFNNTADPHRQILMRGRHAIRSKNIAQKKLASMDLTSLNQIFMTKA